MSKISMVIGLLLLMTVPAAPVPAQWIEDGAQLTPYSYVQWLPDAVSDGEGGAIICWEDYRNNAHWEIFAQRVNADGNELWTPGGVNITQAFAVDQRRPRICSDDAGGAIIVYQNNNVGNWNINAQRVDADGNIQWQIGGVFVCSQTSDQTYPRIVADQTGGAVIAWHDYRGPDLDLYAQRINSNGAVQWDANGIAVCTAEEDQFSLEMVFSGHGGAIIAWTDYRPVTTTDVYAQRVYNNSVSWAVDGVPICTREKSQGNVAMCTDDNDGAYIVWEDSRNTSVDIYAQRINDGGTVQWTNNGIGICTAAEGQTDPAATEDGSGGAIIAWSHYNCAGLCNWNIRAQRIDESAGIYWTPGGDIVVSATKHQTKPKLVGDGLGGAIFVWDDERYGDIDLFAQRLDGSAVKLWAVQGVPVSETTFRQHYPVIVTDGEEGAIIAWADERHNLQDANYDVYVQRMEQNGYWGNPAPHILSVEDVPHDQGGKLTVTFDASYLDAFPYSEIDSYVIFRSLTGPPSYSWVLHWSIDAYELGTYSFTDNTTADSSLAGPANHHYKVLAYRDDYVVYWESEPDSGHSVDNTSPAPPSGLAGEPSRTPVGLQMTWNANGESDLASYAVYRGFSDGFAPAPQNRIGAPEDPAYFDSEWRWDGGYYYKVSAIDRNGNESEWALLGPDDITGGETPPVLPAVTYLAQNYPNPFNPSTTIRYGLDAPAHVTLSIYDAAGRLVRVLVNDFRARDQYEIQWDGRNGAGWDAASGIYFYRLETGTYDVTKKMILLR